MVAIYCIGGLVAFLFIALDGRVHCLHFYWGRCDVDLGGLIAIILSCVFWPFFIMTLVTVLIQDEIKKRFGKEG